MPPVMKLYILCHTHESRDYMYAYKWGGGQKPVKIKNSKMYFTDIILRRQVAYVYS